MQVTKFKKAVLVLGLGLGLSGALSNVAFAGLSASDCARFEQQCMDGNASACNTFKYMCKWWGGGTL